MRNCPVCTRIEKCPVLEQAPARQAAGPCRVSPPSQIRRRTSCARGRFSRAGNVAVATGKLPRERMGWSRRVQAPKAPPRVLEGPGEVGSALPLTHHCPLGRCVLFHLFFLPIKVLLIFLCCKQAAKGHQEPPGKAVGVTRWMGVDKGALGAELPGSKSKAWTASVRWSRLTEKASMLSYPCSILSRRPPLEASTILGRESTDVCAPVPSLSWGSVGHQGRGSGHPPTRQILPVGVGSWGFPHSEHLRFDELLGILWRERRGRRR